MSFFFHCPSCFYHQVLNNYIIVNAMPPAQSFTFNFTPSSTNFLNLDSYNCETYSDESDFNETDSDETHSDETDYDETNSDETDFDETDSDESDCDETNSDEIGSNETDFDNAHFFHSDCIVPWLINNNTCPLCRHKLPQEDEEEIENHL
ncbi:hypothetical protein MTR67_001485 [Solanum verrucosum]|uniref:Zinc finger RING-H2-type domain-containing protein n=1 Tax=Solanum verrucosum TaxID=315347 RepID=A0AAF0PRY7_SOLVR|nr:hypothetical protein MTR67_001485 [Solanum verrucosum]